MLKGLKDAAVKSVKDAIPIREAADLCRQRAAETQQVAEGTRASEVADARFEELRGAKSVGARLGAILVARNTKVADLVSRWDPNGDGVDMKEFRGNVLALGIEARGDEVDELFQTLDEDGGGTLDVDEIKHALKALQEASASSDIELAQLKKTTVELAKSAKSAQVELRKQQKQDEVEAEAKAALLSAELEKQREAAREARLQREKAIAAKKAAIEAEKRAFEEKIIALRARTSAAMGRGTKAIADPNEEQVNSAKGEGSVAEDD